MGNGTNADVIAFTKWNNQTLNNERVVFVSAGYQHSVAVTGNLALIGTHYVQPTETSSALETTKRDNLLGSSHELTSHNSFPQCLANDGYLLLVVVTTPWLLLVGFILRFTMQWLIAYLFS